jgi:nucleoside-diphosphate-sugar epimerase
MEAAVAEMPTGIILRYGLFYGPATWYSRDEWTTQRVLAGEMVATDAVVSFIHVADAAEAARLALDWPAGAYNIVDDEPAAGTAWLPLYATLVGAPPPPTKAGKEAWERGASNAKARSLGWRPRYASWREGFREVLG